MKTNILLDIEADVYKEGNVLVISIRDFLESLKDKKRIEVVIDGNG